MYFKLGNLGPFYALLCLQRLADHQKCDDPGVQNVGGVGSFANQDVARMRDDNDLMNNNGQSFRTSLLTIGV